MGTLAASVGERIMCGVTGLLSSHALPVRWGRPHKGSDTFNMAIFPNALGDGETASYAFSLPMAMAYDLPAVLSQSSSWIGTAAAPFLPRAIFRNRGTCRAAPQVGSCSPSSDFAPVPRSTRCRKVDICTSPGPVRALRYRVPRWNRVVEACDDRCWGPTSIYGFVVCDRRTCVKYQNWFRSDATIRPLCVMVNVQLDVP